LEPTNLTSSLIELSSFVELKALPNHFKYVYLDKQEPLPVIIALHLTVGHEESLMSVLKKNKETIG